MQPPLLFLTAPCCHPVRQGSVCGRFVRSPTSTPPDRAWEMTPAVARQRSLAGAREPHAIGPVPGETRRSLGCPLHPSSFQGVLPNTDS